MNVNDEMIACYIDGTATAEECNLVRRYLCEHPEEYEHLLHLMDHDTNDYLNEWNKNVDEEESLEEHSAMFEQPKPTFSFLSYSAAAFAPTPKRSAKPRKSPKAKRVSRSRTANSEEFLSRLSNMCAELESLD